jgi:ATP adenylyltransferase
MVVRHVVAIAEPLYKAHGWNIGINQGSVAGAGVPGHLHVHAVPRWEGDSNFMPVLADVRVVSQRLDQLWERLRDAMRANPMK